MGTVGKLCDIIFKLFINWSSVRNNLGALSVESARKRNRLLKVNLDSSLTRHSEQIKLGNNWDKGQERLLFVSADRGYFGNKTLSALI